MYKLTDEQLTKIYKEANNIEAGKSPPICTSHIFHAMRAAYDLGIAGKHLPIMEQAKLELDREKYNEAVAKAKKRLQNGAYIWDKLFPFTIKIERKKHGTN